MGHINLAAPVAHIWYFKGAPSKLSLLMNVAPKALSAVVYFAKYLVLAVDKDEKVKVVESLNTQHAEALVALEETIKSDMEKVMNLSENTDVKLLVPKPSKISAKAWSSKILLPRSIRLLFHGQTYCPRCHGRRRISQA
jgi:DNA-directed RNA polymerase subunit beta'